MHMRVCDYVHDCVPVCVTQKRLVERSMRSWDMPKHCSAYAVTYSLYALSVVLSAKAEKRIDSLVLSDSCVRTVRQFIYFQCCTIVVAATAATAFDVEFQKKKKYNAKRSNPRFIQNRLILVAPHHFQIKDGNMASPSNKMTLN